MRLLLTVTVACLLSACVTLTLPTQAGTATVEMETERHETRERVEE